MLSFARVWAVFLVLALLGSPVVGQAMAVPMGEVVLTVGGDVSISNDRGVAAFDMDMLLSLPATEFKTSTIWTDGIHTYRGVLLSDLLAALDSEGRVLLASSISDYLVEIPASDAQANGPIIAYEVDGRRLSVRDRGPLWIVYPFDGHPEFQSEVIYTRSIWQLDRIDILK